MEAPFRFRIADNILKRIRAWLNAGDDNAVLLPDYDSLNAIHELFMRSFLMGVDSALEGNDKNNFADTPLLPDMPISTLPYEEAISFLRTKIPMTRKEYYDLDAKLRLRAFTVGRLNDVDAVNQMKGIFQRNMETGGGLSGFLKMTDDEILNGLGLGKGNELIGKLFTGLIKRQFITRVGRWLLKRTRQSLWNL